MVKTGHGEIRRVRFVPPAPSVGDIEVNTLEGIRDRGGPHEFLTSQRLDFDLLMHIESGAAVHTVDFDDHTLAPATSCGCAPGRSTVGGRSARSRGRW